MNAMELYLLGRRLMQIAERALPQNKGATSLRLVLIDVAYHPDTSISEITERCGFPQSLVSMSVARLRDIGVVETAPDPADRRRTLVRPTEGLNARATDGAGTASVDQALGEALDSADGSQYTEVSEALDLLARSLVPEVAAMTPSANAES